MLFVISGKARSGKDSIFNILKRCGGFQRIAFADPLKRICSEAFDIPLDTFYNDDLKDLPFETPIQFVDYNRNSLSYLIDATLPNYNLVFKSPRDLLQQVGMLVRDEVDKEYWIKLLIADIKKMEGNICITDARLSNEREALKSIGGMLMLVKKPNIDEKDAHISENDLGEDSEYSLIVNNTGTLAQLEHDVTMWYSLKYAK